MPAKPKNLNHLVKLVVGAGQASPQPPVGPALGSKGVKAIDFCKDFNARTAHYIPGTPIPVMITIKPDRTFAYVMKSPPTGWLLLQAAGAEKGAPDGNTTVGTVNLKQVYELAKIKKMDDIHKNKSLESIVKQMTGVAKSVGVNIIP